MSTRLADGPAPGQRAGAILQWEFLRSQSQDLPRMTYRLQEMEGELATLRWLASRQREAMITLQAQVDEARTAFVGPASLVLALVLTGGWAAFLLPGARAAAGRSRSRAKGQGFPTDQVALPLPAGPFAVDIDLGPHAGALRENAHA